MDICTGWRTAIFKLFKISTVRQEQLTSEDIYAVVDAGAQAGVLKQQEHYLIKYFDMQERTVTSTMSTREYIAYFDKHDDSDTVLEMMSENRTTNSSYVTEIWNASLATSNRTRC